MMRQLLTLIAILTGLTALGAPAQARMSAIDDVQVQVAGDAAAACSSAQILARAAPAGPLGRGVGQASFCPRPSMVIVIPPVMLQADRARE